MGLDTTHGAWHGAYSAFNRWRNQIAVAAGYQLTGGPHAAPSYIDWNGVTEANLDGEWDTPPDEPLTVLLAHYDCEGHINPRDAGPLADRLEALLPKLKGLDGGGHIGSYEDTTQRFINGLRLAASRGEQVLFQ